MIAKFNALHAALRHPKGEDSRDDLTLASFCPDISWELTDIICELTDISCELMGSLVLAVSSLSSLF